MATDPRESCVFLSVVRLVLVGTILLVLAGCESTPPTSDIAVRVGMSREDLRQCFGEPLRVEPAADGAENWYYRFVAWRAHPTGESGTSIENGELTAYSSAGLEFSKDPEEHPIHVSPQGFVVEPLPTGKVVKH